MWTEKEISGSRKGLRVGRGVKGGEQKGTHHLCCELM